MTPTSNAMRMMLACAGRSGANSPRSPERSPERRLDRAAAALALAIALLCTAGFGFGQTLVVTYYGQTLASGGETYIAPTGAIGGGPMMPPIRVAIRGCGTIDYYVTVDFTTKPVNGRTAQTHNSITPSGSLTCSGILQESQYIPWNYMPEFYGGSATIWYSVNGGAYKEFYFTIHGVNPANSLINSTLSSLVPSGFPPTLFEKMLTIESGVYNTKYYPTGHYHQFFGYSGTTFNGIALSNGYGPPLWGGNKQGVGMDQIDFSGQSGSPLPPAGDFWNWMDNLKTGIGILNQKVNHAETAYKADWNEAGDLLPGTSGSTHTGYSGYDTLVYPSAGHCSFVWNTASTPSNGFVTANIVKGYNSFHKDPTIVPAAEDNGGFRQFIPKSGTVAGHWVTSDSANASKKNPGGGYVKPVCLQSPPS